MLSRESLYVVQIRYREPEYEARVGRSAEPYRWTYQIEAPSRACAVEIALREFREMQRLSSVGWGRDVVGVRVRPVASP